MKVESRLRVSVIVPVFNHWDLVPALLACLKAQTLPHDLFELLIVDNGSDVLPSAPELPPFAHLLHCPVPGSYAARNLAVAEAQGELLAFTDADCRPQADWLERGLGCHLRASAKALIAGEIQVVPRAADAPTLYEIYDMILGLPQRRYVERGYAITANLFVPKRVMAEVGMFDASRFSGGDAEFCRRAVAAGHTLEFCTSSVVLHPARREWHELAAKARRIKGGQIAAGPQWRRVMWVCRTFIPPVSVWRIVMRASAFSRRHRLAVCWIKTRLWGVEILTMLGLLAGRPPNR